MSNTIVNFAVHDLRRVESAYSIELGNHNLPVNQSTQRFVDELYHRYSRRSSKLYGHFADNEDNYPTQKHIREFLSSNPSDFATLTSKMMLTLQKQAGLKPASEGGHVFFAHINADGSRYLLVALVNDKTSAALTAQYGLNEVTHLDLDGYRFAGRIDITRWQAKHDRYIDFLKGRGDVSDYFKDFLGCESAIKAVVETGRFVDALHTFMESQSMTSQEKTKFLKKAVDICDTLSKAKHEIEFETVSNELWPKAPKLLVAALADAKVSEGFVPDRRAARALNTYKADTGLYSIEVTREALTDKTVVFNPKEETLTFKHLPASLVASLKRDLIDDAPPSV